jgi:hypothetical protein
MARTQRESAPPSIVAPLLPPGAHVSCHQDEDMVVVSILVAGEVVKLGLSPLMSNWQGPWTWLLAKAWAAHYRATLTPFDLSNLPKGGE